MSSVMQRQVEFLHRLEELVEEAGVLLEKTKYLVQRIDRPRYAAQHTAQLQLEERRQQQRLVAQALANQHSPNKGLPGTSKGEDLGRGDAFKPDTLGRG